MYLKWEEVRLWEIYFGRSIEEENSSTEGNETNTQGENSSTVDQLDIES